MTVIAPVRDGDLEVRAGRVPDRLDGAAYTGPLDAAAPGRYLLNLPTVGRFLVTAGPPCRVRVQRAPGATDADVGCLLAGPVRAVRDALAGRFGLRGCGVVRAGRALILTGPAAAGKSAVAAVLANAGGGAGVLADGVVPVNLTRHGPVAGSVDSGLKLWPGAVDLLGIDAAGGEPVRPGLAQRRYPFPPAAPAPLAAVVVLRRERRPGPPHARVAGFAAVEALLGWTAMQPVLGALGLGCRYLAWLAALARAVPVVEVRSDRHSVDLPDVAARVAGLVWP